jgi:hypothetical protein
VIVAVPELTAVTLPEPLTVATLVLLDDQVTFLFVAFDGLIVTVNVSEPPAFIVVADLFSDTPVTGITTVTAQVAFFVLSICDVAVIVAVPELTAVTLPEPLTVAALEKYPNLITCT